jgi:hypothetical protein
VSRSIENRLLALELAEVLRFAQMEEKLISLLRPDRELCGWILKVIKESEKTSPADSPEFPVDAPQRGPLTVLIRQSLGARVWLTNVLKRLEDEGCAHQATHPRPRSLATSASEQSEAKQR